MTTQILTYAVWKQVMNYLSGKSMGTVYYTLIGGHYVPYLVDLNLNLIFSSPQLNSTDQTDFINNIKPTATLINMAGDAVALAVMATVA